MRSVQGFNVVVLASNIRCKKNSIRYMYVDLKGCIYKQRRGFPIR